MMTVSQVVSSIRMLWQPWGLISSMIEDNITDGEHSPLLPHGVHHLLHLAKCSLTAITGESSIEPMLVSQGVGRVGSSQGLRKMNIKCIGVEEEVAPVWG